MYCMHLYMYYAYDCYNEINKYMYGLRNTLIFY